jgi:hypothetical protein
VSVWVSPRSASSSVAGAARHPGAKGWTRSAARKPAARYATRMRARSHATTPWCSLRIVSAKRFSWPAMKRRPRRVSAA